MKKMFSLFLCIPLLLAFAFAGCKQVSSNTSPKALAPGAANQADQDIYQGLRAAQGALKSLQATLADATVDANTKATLKPFVNQAIQDYDVADAAWQAYHAVAIANPKAPATVAQQALTKLQTDLQTMPGVTK